MMTELGYTTYKLVQSYGLGQFYNKYMGNLIILESMITVEMMSNILNFLKNNEDWIMGYENCFGESSIYITQKENLN